MPDMAVKAWLYAAARNAAIDIKRRERFLKPFPQFESSEEGDSADAAFSAGLDITDSITVEALLEKLPPPLGLPVRMKYFQRMNATEIGAAMGLPPGTVRTRLRTAIIRMRILLAGKKEQNNG
jgi:RNA polymerase sigma-70 factor (ECF subfamily)